MDSNTLKICETHPDIDIAACALVRLLASCKGQQMHGKAGLVTELKAGTITLLHETKDSTTLVKTT